MNFRKVFAALLLLCAVALVGCSGKSNQPCTVNCGGGGTASLNLTLTATHLTPPPNTNLFSFFFEFNTLTLNPATRTPRKLHLNSTTLLVGLNVPSEHTRF